MKKRVPLFVEDESSLEPEPPIPKSPINIVAERKLIYGRLDASKYPSRMGQPWKDDEVAKLLASIQCKKSSEEIAKEHERTVGGIIAQIKKLAVDYYVNDKRSLEDIQNITGLTIEQIKLDVQKHEYKAGKKSSKTDISTEHNTTNNKVTIDELHSLMLDIQRKLDYLIERVA